nr:prolyl oligopeptidase family serine peptidase [Pedobacter sp. ASV2]
MRTVTKFLAILGFVVMTNLYAQNQESEIKKLTSRFCQITDPKLSDDGKWLSFRKFYDENMDTLMVFNSLIPERPVGFRVKINNIIFLPNSYLLLGGNEKAELWNLKTQASTWYSNVQKVEHIKSKNLFIIHRNDSLENMLDLFDGTGKLLNQIKNVEHFVTDLNGRIYAVVKQGATYSVLRIDQVSTEKLYSSVHRIYNITPEPKENGFISTEYLPDGKTQELIYVDLLNKKEYPLKNDLPLQFGYATVETFERDQNSFYLKLLLYPKPQETRLVDIWYGNDKQMEKKVYPDIREVYYLWNPQKGEIKQIGNSKLVRSVNINNSQYFMAFDIHKYNNYLRYEIQAEINIYDKAHEKYTVIDKVWESLYVSPNGKYLVYRADKKWKLYEVSTQNNFEFSGPEEAKPHFTTDGKGILFDGKNGLWRFNISKKMLVQLQSYPGSNITLYNAKNNVLFSDIGFSVYSTEIDDRVPLMCKLYNDQDNTTAYTLIDLNKKTVLIPATKKRINTLIYNPSFTRYVYTEENYNLPTRIMSMHKNEKPIPLYQSNKGDKKMQGLQQEIIHYINSEGIPLKGILYYPVSYDPKKKYPIVVRLYEIQNKTSNEYLVTAFTQNRDGFDIRLLLEKGYFVYKPDIVFGGNGTGLSALDCVTHSLNALPMNASIDKKKIGLIGHSHGGYETNFIATHSDRFAAYVSGAGNSDIVRSYFSFNYNFHSPFYWQYETGQYKMKKSFKDDRALYFQNNPIYHVDQVNAPILLWAGKKDENIAWDQVMEFYVGLKRNDKSVVALFYPNEGHSLEQFGARKDLVVRTLDWFDYFLKDEKDIDWINFEMKKNAE